MNEKVTPDVLCTFTCGCPEADKGVHLPERHPSSNQCRHCGLSSDVPKCEIQCLRSQRDIELLRNQRDSNLAKEIEQTAEIKRLFNGAMEQLGELFAGKQSVRAGGGEIERYRMNVSRQRFEAANVALCALGVAINRSGGHETRPQCGERQDAYDAAAAAAVEKTNRDAARYRVVRVSKLISERIAPWYLDAACDEWIAKANAVCKAEKATAHAHSDACWEPESGCDMGRNETFAEKVNPHPGGFEE